ncbi:hypothetical protein DSBG_1438 [Desulfosporosinus sp. BG]|nr:hypothetical protein DSBG_1438 [Desulfosporosinus sp. BG]
MLYLINTMTVLISGEISMLQAMLNLKSRLISRRPKNIV